MASQSTRTGRSRKSIHRTDPARNPSPGRDPFSTIPDTQRTPTSGPVRSLCLSSSRSSSRASGRSQSHSPTPRRSRTTTPLAPQSLVLRGGSLPPSDDAAFLADDLDVEEEEERSEESTEDQSWPLHIGADVHLNSALSAVEASLPVVVSYLRELAARGNATAVRGGIVSSLVDAASLIVSTAIGDESISVHGHAVLARE